MSAPTDLLIFSAICAAIAQCVVEVPLVVHARHREDYYDADSSAVRVFKSPSDDVRVRKSKAGPTKLYQYNYNDEYCSIRDVKLGNPPRSFELSLFNYEYRSAVFDPGFTQFACPKVANYSLSRPRTYDASRSTTSRRRQGEGDYEIGMVVNWLCQDFWDAVGYKVTDDVRINGFLSKATNFTVLGAVEATLDNQWKSDGFIGLMRLDGAFATDESTVYTLAKNTGGSPEITLSYKRVDNPIVEPVVAGSLTLGGKNVKDCESKWYRMQDGSLGGGFSLVNWNVAITKFQFGAYANEDPSYTIPEVGSSFIEAPLPHFEAIVRGTGAVKDPRGKYVVDCKKVPELPPLNFDLLMADNSTLAFFVEARDYVRNILPRKDGNCSLQVVPTDADSGWVFGTSATKNFCWNFNYATNILALARSTLS